MSPSLRGFLSSLEKRVKNVLRGSGPLDRVKLTVLIFLDSVPRTILRGMPRLERLLRRIKKDLMRGMVVKFQGSRFRIVDEECLFILSQDFEDWMWKYIYSLRPGGVFVDVGAHVGRYTIAAAKIVGKSGLVVAIEPHPENYEFLMKNVELNELKNVVCLKLAAWSTECDLKLFIGDTHGHHSTKMDFGLGSIVVRAKPLDKVVEELDLKKIDLIKIDVEGAELEVLKGTLKTLQRYRPMVVVEVLGDSKDVEELARQVGYGVQKVAPFYYVLKPRKG